MECFRTECIHNAYPVTHVHNKTNALPHEPRFDAKVLSIVCSQLLAPRPPRGSTFEGASESEVFL